VDVMARLLDASADPNQRGLNDWTALHMAVYETNVEAVRRLLARGADRELRTRIDDCDTPL
jgi:ankyrin repeat protein